MTREQIKVMTCAIFHDGLDVDSLSAKAKAELRAALEILLASSSLTSNKGETA